MPLGVCAPGKLLKIGAVRLHLEQILHDMVENYLYFMSLTRFMNHMMSHHSYIILCNHTKLELLGNVTIVRQ